MNRDTPQALLQEALAHHQAGRLDEAAALYGQVLEAEPEHPDALHLSGALRYQAGDLEAASALVGKAVTVAPKVADYHNTLGLVLTERGQAQEAVAELREAVGCEPGHVEAHYNLGNALMTCGEAVAAEASYRQALALHPGFTAAHNNLGRLLAEMDRLEEAEAALGEALKLAPGYAPAHYNLGRLEEQRENFSAAENGYRRALELNSGYVEAHNNLGNVLRLQGRLAEAKESFNRALELRPSYSEAFSNLGMIHMAEGEVDQAEQVFRQAITLGPDNANAHHNLALALLMMERFEEGWEEYEWRWKKPNVPNREFPQEVWKGEPLNGKTLLVWAEQGLGDEIRFAGMVPEIMEKGASVILESEPRLVPLFARSFPGVTCVAKSSPPAPGLLSEDIDFQTSAGGLCRYLRPDLESFPQGEGYLRADPDQTRALRERYKEENERVLVGISWGSINKMRPWKGIPLMEWRPVLEVPGIAFVDLQYGDTEAEHAAVRAETGIELLYDESIDPLEDMDAFAAQVAAMDLVVSVGNSTVEVAGALGVPVWTFVSFDSHWVWMREREHSLWYPGMRLYRQSARGDWESVINRVAGELEKMAESP
ncbi:MAG: tetratricopeptide repeat protein [Alphaproteobacteria bacterium]|nr:tetratricopeptide repeat protein [Alphaproteobacteria bacterium]